MIKTIYLHIGFHKTASTSIQQTLFNNRHILAREGYLYPGFTAGDRKITNHSEVFFSMFNPRPDKYHMNLVKHYDTIEKTDALHESYRQQFKMMVTSFTGHSLVISGEDISGLTEVRLRELRDFLIENTHPDVLIKVIAFARHPVDWTISKIQEIVKGGNSMDAAIERSLMNQKPFYMLMTKRFKRVFQDHFFELYPFEDTVKYPGGIIQKFLSVIGFDKNTARNIRNEFVNVSLSHEAIVLLGEIFGQIPLYKGNQQNPELNDFFRENIFSMPGQKFSVEPKIKSEIWKNAQADVKWLHEEMKFPLYQLEKQKVDDSQKWNEEVIRFLNSGFLSRFSEPVVRLILNAILKEISRYWSVFSMKKKIALFTYWVDNSACYQFRNKQEKYNHLANLFGKTKACQLRLFIILYMRFPGLFDGRK